MSNAVYKNPEPVPTASQLAVLPFLAGLYGHLSEKGDVPNLRLTMHRTMSREGDGYLQQVCGYINASGVDWKGNVGRTFEVNTGIMGAAYGSKKIWATKRFESVDELRPLLEKDLTDTNFKGDRTKLAISYLAIPFLSAEKDVALILYADCKQLNFFADEDQIRRVVAMCGGFSKMIDSLQKDHIPNFRNFPLPRKKGVEGERTLFVSIQKEVSSVPPPQFNVLMSFNFDLSPV